MKKWAWVFVSSIHFKNILLNNSNRIYHNIDKFSTNSFSYSCFKGHRTGCSVSLVRCEKTCLGNKLKFNILDILQRDS